MYFFLVQLELHLTQTLSRKLLKVPLWLKQLWSGVDRKYRKESLFGKDMKGSGVEGGSFKTRKISKLPHQGFYVTATPVMIQECTEKAGTQRKMQGTVNSLFCEVFFIKGHCLFLWHSTILSSHSTNLCSNTRTAFSH